jgi:transcriptional regulator with XRE-family HTH domain
MVTATPTRAAPRSGRSRPQDVDRHVARRMRERRIMLGLTQQQVAGMIGVTYQQAHKYETGLNRISAGLLHALAHALGVGPGYFFQGLGEGEPAGPTAGQRRLLDLTRSFAALPRRQQEALAELARALAGAEVAAA